MRVPPVIIRGTAPLASAATGAARSARNGTMATRFTPGLQRSGPVTVSERIADL